MQFGLIARLLAAPQVHGNAIIVGDGLEPSTSLDAALVGWCELKVQPKQ